MSEETKFQVVKSALAKDLLGDWSEVIDIVNTTEELWGIFYDSTRDVRKYPNLFTKREIIELADEDLKKKAMAEAADNIQDDADAQSLILQTGDWKFSTGDASWDTLMVSWRKQLKSELGNKISCLVQNPHKLGIGSNGFGAEIEDTYTKELAARKLWAQYSEMVLNGFNKNLSEVNSSIDEELGKQAATK